MIHTRTILRSPTRMSFAR